MSDFLVIAIPAVMIGVAITCIMNGRLVLRHVVSAFVVGIGLGLLVLPNGKWGPNPLNAIGGAMILVGLMFWPVWDLLRKAK